MEFERSTQARSWLFTNESLSQCREHRAKLDASSNQVELPTTSKKVRKFASGFDRRFQKATVNQDDQSLLTKRRSEEEPSSLPSTLSLEEQEVVLRFHANQICKLVGPAALFPELRRSPKVVSTAIMLFRRFYLSNNVLDFDCRHAATAAALLGCKVEEERVQVGMLAYATVCIYREAKATPLYGSELRAISVEGIEAAERALLEGLNYEMMCYHPTDAVRMLASDLSDYFASSCDGPVAQFAYHLGEDVHARAQAVCYRALICSDAPFLFAPGKIAFAAATIALKSIDCNGLQGDEMEDFLVCRFPNFSEEELGIFGEQVYEIVQFLQDCPAMELSSSQEQQPWNEAEELLQVLVKLANNHTVKMVKPAVTAVSSAPTTEPRRKRSRLEIAQSETGVTTSSWKIHRKCPKVTPVSQHCSPITTGRR